MGKPASATLADGLGAISLRAPCDGTMAPASERGTRTSAPVTGNTLTRKELEERRRMRSAAILTGARREVGRIVLPVEPARPIAVPRLGGSRLAGAQGGSACRRLTYSGIA